MKYFILIFVIFLMCTSFEGSYGQKYDQPAPKKPVLTNKYLLKKRDQPFEGSRYGGMDRLPKPQRIATGEFKGKKKYTNTPRQSGFASFKGSEKLTEPKRQSGFASFKGSEKLTEPKRQSGFATFRSKQKFKDPRYKSPFAGLVAPFTKSSRVSVSKFKGPVKLKMAPRKYNKASNRSMKFHKKPYNIRRIKKGKWMWKKNMPEYQKNPHKIKHDPQENHIWQNDPNTPAWYTNPQPNPKLKKKAETTSAPPPAPSEGDE